MSAGDCIGPDNVEEVLHRIDQMTLSELRLFWSGRWGAAPGLRSVGLLKHLIAWRIQVAIFGGLDPETRGLLRSRSIPTRPRPAVGTRLTREYLGVLHQVEILDRGVLYDGQQFSSLSKAAQAITGTHWNGPRFFGLRGRP